MFAFIVKSDQSIVYDMMTYCQSIVYDNCPKVFALIPKNCPESSIIFVVVFLCLVIEFNY